MTPSPGSRRIPLWLIPNATVFFSSACIMVVELVAGKLIARHVGMSLYTWTSIIGIVMAGISIGNFLGGKLADRYRPSTTLAVLFFAAAAGCLSVLPVNGLSGTVTPFLGLPWVMRVFIHVSIVFFAPATLLGMINPVVAKMALDFRRAQGRTVGGVFAWGVAGSLVGTFATGFHLVSVWRVSTIVVVSASGLALLGALYLAAAWRGRISSPAPSKPVTAAAVTGAELWAAARIWTPAAVTVFISNAAFMAFELALMRMVAREFGGSLYAWTTVIGIVLAGISLGNYCGGRLADRHTAKSLISLVFCLAALAVMASPSLHTWMTAWRGNFWRLASLSWPMQILINVAFVGFVPCVFIGMVSPVVTRRLLEQGKAPGASVGAVYAWGSVGAIVGTFMTGYVLIQWIGSTSVVAAVALLLALTALAYTPKCAWTLAATALCGGITVMALFAPSALHTTSARLGYRSPDNPNRVYEDESQYAYIAVLEDGEEPDTRVMYLDRLVHTRIDMSDHTRLLYEYELVYSAIMESRTALPEPVRAFVLGGGGYAYPHYLELVRPGSDIVVAEIDPAVTEAAHAAMGLPRDTSITIHHLDARNVVTDMLRRLEVGEGFQRFDFIFGDSINDYTVPFHLTTREFKQAMHDLLTDDGVYLFNMIDMFDSGAFLAAVVNTCRQVFPQVAVFNTGRPTFIRDTFVVVCSREDTPVEDVTPMLRRQGHLGEKLSDETIDALIEKNNQLLLTDDFAPVENLLAPVVRTRVAHTGVLHLSFASRYAAEGDFDRAVRHCHQALEMHPRWPQAYEVLAEILAMKGDTDGAIEALAAAIPEDNPGPSLYNLATALMAAERNEEAAGAWREYIKVVPESVSAWYNLGVVYGELQEYMHAVNAWRKALDLDPHHADSLYNLAVAEIMRSNTDAARKLVETMLEAGHNVDVDMLRAVGLLQQ